ncbi:hypothetical protein SNOG_02143 [Parastagonospora nodorum SN15]|uniref:Uncharacterized protein n=1 Tax=Phaeosphaeria nodorum (strain SN15 / ATCC MYA-4574 / FGSC 10173) TaxID=321614 RepID=Q0V1H1_PHANO|nr:hypothetical protein SNOG_02143 [Parastagonospora nodorum SN15]EAT90355.1 hypothetical protein SNOG_02143 [Parastagonospora nodorum SN15]
MSASTDSRRSAGQRLEWVGLPAARSGLDKIMFVKINTKPCNSQRACTEAAHGETKRELIFTVSVVLR